MVVGFLRSIGYFLVGIPISLIGLPVVALALPFRVEHPETSKPFTQYPALGTWRLVTLPTWVKWFSNEFDGALGDKRGWWANYCLKTYGQPHTTFYCMWRWLAVRNPTNWWSRVVTGIDVSRCAIVKVAGDDYVTDEPGIGFQWQILDAVRDDGRHFPRVYLVAPWWFDPAHAVTVDIGWKIRLAHNGTAKDADISDRLKGSVFNASPWKTL